MNRISKKYSNSNIEDFQIFAQPYSKVNTHYFCFSAWQKPSKLSLKHSFSDQTCSFIGCVQAGSVVSIHILHTSFPSILMSILFYSVISDDFRFDLHTINLVAVQKQEKICRLKYSTQSRLPGTVLSYVCDASIQKI